MLHFQMNTDSFFPYSQIRTNETIFHHSLSCTASIIHPCTVCTCMCLYMYVLKNSFAELGSKNISPLGQNVVKRQHLGCLILLNGALIFSNVYNVAALALRLFIGVYSPGHQCWLCSIQPLQGLHRDLSNHQLHLEHPNPYM